MTRRSWVAIALTCLAISLGLLLTVGPIPGVDTSTFMTVGRGWLHGLLPYRDLWDNKPPGIYAMTAVSAMFADAWLALRALSAAAIALAAMCLAAIVARTGAPRLSVATTALVGSAVLSFAPASLGGGMTETFAIPAMCAALLIGYGGRLTKGRAIATGVMVGVAITCSLQAVAIIPVLGYIVLRERLGLRAIARTIGLFIVGGMIIAVVVLAPFMAGNAIPDMFDALLTYNARYRLSSHGVPWYRIAFHAVVYSAMWLPLFVTFVPWAKGAKRRFSPLVRVALLWVSIATLMLAYGGRIYLHYLLFLAPGFLLLLGAGLDRLSSIESWRDRTFLTAIALTMTVGLLGMQTGGIGLLSDPDHLIVEARIASLIRDRTDPADTIYVWGYDPNIYEASGRTPAGRFLYQHPLTTADYGQAAADEMLAVWVKAPPKIIVDVSANLPGQSTISPLLRYHEIAQNDGRTETQQLDGLRDFVRTHYREIAVIGELPIYELIED